MSQFIEMFYNGKYTVDKLREHIDVIRGVSYKPSDVYETHNENTSIVLRSNNIEGGQINFDDLVYVSTERVSELQLLRVGDIVMCGSNGSKKLVGKAAMLQETPTIRTSFGAFCLGIRCKLTLVPEYLATYFQTSLYRDEIEQLGSGSNILNIKPDHIYDLEVPIPLYDEQMAFVSIVRQADKSEFVGFKSQFIEMFNDSPLVRLEDHIETQSGGTPNTKKSEYYDGGTIPWLSSGEVNQGYISSTEKYITEEGLENSAAKWVPKNSVVIAMYGATAGKVGFITIPLTTNQAVCALLPNDAFNPLYLYYAVSSQKNWMIAQCRGAAQPNISQGIIRSMEIPMPSLSEQMQFVNIIKQADKSEYYN